MSKMILQQYVDVAMLPAHQGRPQAPEHQRLVDYSAARAVQGRELPHRPAAGVAVSMGALLGLPLGYSVEKKMVIGVRDRQGCRAESCP